MELTPPADADSEGGAPLVDPFAPPPPPEPPPPEPEPAREAPRPPPRSLRALLHHSFVEYDPRYLISAVLVLAGLTLLSCDLGQRDAVAGLGLSFVAELYALLLIGGAAMLRRFGQRRMAVMLGLLAALYQCDLTLHVERDAFLGAVGLAAALGWIALFALKLHLLARALGLRLSRAALVVAVGGACSVALTPLLAHAMWRWGQEIRTLGVFAAVMPGLFVRRTVESDVGFDYRGRRAIHGTWALWGAAAIAHALFDGIDPIPLASVLLLFATRWARSERTFWALIALALAPTLAHFGDATATPLLVAITLALRALRSASDPARLEPPAPVPSPYRGGPSEPGPVVPALLAPTYAPAPEPWRTRYLVTALALGHFAIWRALFPRHGGFPEPALEHVLALDLLLAAACALWIWRARHPVPVLALAPTVLHGLVASGALRAPRNLAEWGAGSVAVGFGLLTSALATAWWKERFPSETGIGGTPDAPRSRDAPLR